jgi:hypothetical protein
MLSHRCVLVGFGKGLQVKSGGFLFIKRPAIEIAGLPFYLSTKHNIISSYTLSLQR